MSKKGSELSLKTLQDLVGKYFKINDISKKTRETGYVWARYVFYRLGLDEGYSLTAIGRQVKVDHATVLHGKNKFADLFNQLDFRKFKDGYYDIKLEIDNSRDEHSNVTDFLLRFKEEINEMDSTKYLFFKAEFLKALGNHVEARSQKNIAISREVAGSGSYIFTGGEGI